MNPTIYSDSRWDNFLFRHLTSVEPRSNFAIHNHDVLELLFVKRGNISYVVEGKSYRLSKNSLVLSRAFDMHALKIHDLTTYERYNIIYDIYQSGSPICRKVPNNVDVINFNGNDLACGIFKKMDYYSEHFQGDILKVILMQLTEEVLYQVLIASKECNQSDICTIHPIINEAIHYINQNITTPLSIDDICNELHIAKSHLHNLFATHLNISPKKYVLSKKLHMIQRELRAGAKPTDVSCAYGFSDYSTFYRDYKHYFGHAPSEETESKIVREFIS